MYFAVEASLNEIEQFMEQMPFATLLLNEREEIVAVNELFLQAVKCDYAQVKHAPLHQFVLFEDKDSLYLKSSFHSLEGELITLEREHLPSDVYLQRWAERDETYMLLLFIDITPECNLSMLQRFAKTFIADVNMGILVIDREERLIELSDVACRLLGVKRKDVINKSIKEAFPELPHDQLLLHRALLDGVIVRNQVTSWTTNNRRYELLMDSNLLRDEYGRVIAAYVVFKDITNLRSLDEQIQRNDRLAMIGQIAAGTAHEIRNPLTSIKGFLQVLKYGLIEKGLTKEKEYADIMLKEINRINDLVSEFLLLSKPRDAKYEEVKISSVIGELLPFIQNEALLHKVEVRYENVKGLPPVIADHELLKQVFLNVCKNGIEAMADGGELTIRERLFEAENKVVVDVHDTGPGIPHYVIDKIFDPFFTTKENGTGLGLPVCQRIIHDIGGNIRVSSKGFGTTFSVFIPYHTKSYRSYC